MPQTRGGPGVPSSPPRPRVLSSLPVWGSGRGRRGQGGGDDGPPRRRQGPTGDVAATRPGPPRAPPPAPGPTPRPASDPAPERTRSQKASGPLQPPPRYCDGVGVDLRSLSG